MIQRISSVEHFTLNAPTKGIKKMNDDGTVSLEFPQFTFPHLPEEVLSFGELHGLGSSPSLFEAHLPAGRPFERIGDSCHKIQARTRLLDDRIQKKDVSTRQKEMVESLLHTSIVHISHQFMALLRRRTIRAITLMPWLQKDSSHRI